MSKKIKMNEVLSQIPPQPNDVAVVLRADGTVDVISYLEEDFAEKNDTQGVIANLITALGLHEMLKDDDFIKDVHSVVDGHEITKSLMH